MTIKNAGAKVGATVSIGNRDKWRWMEKGECSKQSVDLTEIEEIETLKERKEVIQKYKNELCFKCEVLATCLEYIVHQDKKDKMPSTGLWGGTYGNERHPLVRAHRDTTIPVEDLVRRWIAKKALYDSRYILVITKEDSGEFLRESNVESLHGARIMQGKLRRSYSFPVVVTLIDNDTGETKIVDPASPRKR